MDIEGIGVFALGSRRIEYLAEQQKTVARNVANADVPGYRALKMRPFAEAMKAASSPAALAVTHPGHMQGTARSGQMPMAVVDRDAPVSPSGNSVVLDEQVMQAAQAQAGHALATTVYRKAADMLLAPVR